MSSTVLARKWRPKTFAALVGQDHVVRALTHALQRGRLHHAYLFTGTRGVGKTTISRILAKSLNCTGPDGRGEITAEPCGVCQSCTEIDAGRFVDYIELDAASNRGVDDMTRLLEQAVYKPTSGRFKVYMIDEVHMLSNHAFNAMLKTLEEPPESVKFVLATTDPQKVPVTVLSRCLQFSLKSMPPAAIAGHLQHVLQAEGVAFEPAALQSLGRAAHGSMRDALSLADQAIAYSAGNVSADAVRQMLGAVDSSHLFDLLRALAAGDGAVMLQLADDMDARGLSFPTALEELAAVLQRIAVVQIVPQAVDAADPDAEALRELAASLSPETVQLAYSMALHGRGELALAPDEHAGFCMVLLRLLAFVPVGTRGHAQPVPPMAGAMHSASQDTASATAPAAPRPIAAPSAASAAPPIPAPLVASPPSPQADAAIVAEQQAEYRAASAAGTEPGVAQQRPVSPLPDKAPFPGPGPDWPALAQSLELVALARSLALQSEWLGADGDVWRLRVPSEQFTRAGALDKLQAALSEAVGRAISLQVEVGVVTDSAHQRAAAARTQRQKQAEATIADDPLVRQLVDDLGAQIVPGSVRPLQA
ncbi:DNA polymerase III subunit gamma/tau [Thiomonas sp.]|uniref:DNA polymerase III subunit gamma/tau n=1 Tax=Thiomonas sp. TaxID=2047785 RepID=UPI0026281F9F|nr:DNA polymerase III subunit gamma/tau [Thiomonas sp.]